MLQSLDSVSYETLHDMIGRAGGREEGRVGGREEGSLSCACGAPARSQVIRLFLSGRI